MLSHVQKIFLLKQMRANSENTQSDNKIISREWETLEQATQNVMYPSNPSFLVSGNTTEKEVEGV